MSALKDRFFLALLAFFGMCALLWGLFLPVHEGPDEQNHYRYICFLKKEGRLPRQLPLPPEVAGEGHQPPLYYALGAAALKAWNPEASWVELPNNPNFAFNANPAWFRHFSDEGFLRFDGYARGPHLLRAAQIFMPLLSLAALWMLLTALPLSQSAARLGFALMALNPGFVFLSGVLNNDHLVTLFFSLSLFVMADSLFQGRWAWGHSLACGIFLGLGALSKISIFCLFPLALGLALARGSKAKAALLLAAALAVCCWFYARNLALYGEPFGWTMHTLTCPDTVHVKSLFDGGWFWFWLKRSVESYWTVFGWLSFNAPRAWMLLFVGLSFLALAGLRRRPWGTQVWLQLMALAGLSAGVVKFNWNFDPPEGRYFYPALLSVGALMALGLNAYAWLKRPAMPWILAGTLASLNVWILFYRLIPLYYNVTP